jgi:hypothetical protein
VQLPRQVRRNPRTSGRKGVQSDFPATKTGTFFHPVREVSSSSTSFLLEPAIFVARLNALHFKEFDLDRSQSKKFGTEFAKSFKAE